MTNNVCVTTSTNIVTVTNTGINVASVGVQGPPGAAWSVAPVLMGTFFLESATNQTITLISSAQYPFAINGLNNLVTTGGTIQVAIQINGTSVTGLSGLTASTVAQNPSATGNNLVNVGDRVTVILSGGTTAANLEFTMGGIYNGSAVPVGPGGGGGITRTINSVSSNTTAGNAALTDYTYFCSSTMTLTMPTAIGNTNRYTIKNVGTGLITLDTTDGQTIETAAGSAIGVQDRAIDLISDNSNWWIV